MRTIVTAEYFNLQNYLDLEREFMKECLEKQLEATPNMSHNEFVEQHFIRRGYASAYMEYYCGNKHKPVYEVQK
jgi:hypothetical protein